MRGQVRERRDGFALVIVILGTLVLSGITLAVLKMGTDEAGAARATRVSASALYVADAGVEATRAEWPELAMMALTPGDSLVLPWDTLAPTAASYHRVIHRRDGGADDTRRIYSLTVDGRTYGPLGGQAAVQVWLTSRIRNLGKFNAAVSSLGDLTLSGSPIGSRTDSYDSRLGNFEDQPVGSQGDVLVNGRLLMSGQAEIGGNAEILEADRSTGLSSVTGTVITMPEPREYDVDTCPLTYSVISGFSTCKSGVCDVSYGGSNKTLTAGTYHFHNFTMGNGAVLTIPSGHVVNIYLSGDLDIGGGATMNNEGKNPGALNFISCAKLGVDPKTGLLTYTSNNTGWMLHGGPNGSLAYWTIYAPTNRVDVSGGSPIWGAIVAKEFEASGGAPIHFDRALISEALDTVTTVTARSWSQLLR